MVSFFEFLKINESSDIVKVTMVMVQLGFIDPFEIWDFE